VRRVDLNIGGTEAKELRDLVTQDRDDVGEEVLEACIADWERSGDQKFTNRLGLGRVTFEMRLVRPRR
jgi:hypothetical protein